MKRALPTVIAVIALAVSVAGCRNGSYGSAQISNQSGDLSASLDVNTAIQIREGSASSAQIFLHAKDGDTLPGNLESADPTILQIEVSSTDQFRFVFLGVKAGTTQVTILAKGQSVATVQATVTAPPVFTLPDAGASPVVSDGGDSG